MHSLYGLCALLISLYGVSRMRQYVLIYVCTPYIPYMVCLMYVLCRNASRVGDKKVYLITDAASQYSDDGLDKICEGLKTSQIDLIVV